MHDEGELSNPVNACTVSGPSVKIAVKFDPQTYRSFRDDSIGIAHVSK